MGLLRGVIDGVSARMAFFPPSPPSYEVTKPDGLSGHLETGLPPNS